MILDNAADAKQTEDVRAIITEILGITPTRGDTLTVVKASFMPLWRTIWQEPEMAGIVVKYSLISLLSLMTLVVVALSLLKLSGAMREMAVSQKTTLSMDLNPGGGLSGYALGAPPALESERLQMLAGPRVDGTQGPDQGPSDAVRFTVRPDQVEVLAEMMSGEDPANVCLVVERVEPAIRAMLLAALSPKAREAIFLNLGRVRYIEPDLILNLKEKLERMLAGSVGGLGALSAMLEGANFSERKRMLEAIAARDPGLGEKLRRRVFLMENLARLTHDEWPLVQSQVSHEVWALALAEGPAAVAQALIANAPEGARKILAQMIAARPGDEASRRAAQSKIAKSVAALTGEGKLADLVGRDYKKIE